MAKRKRTKLQTMIYKTLHTENERFQQHEPQKKNIGAQYC